MLKVISKFDGKICLTFSELVLSKDKKVLYLQFLLPKQWLILAAESLKITLNHDNHLRLPASDFSVACISGLRTS